MPRQALIAAGGGALSALLSVRFLSSGSGGLLFAYLGLLPVAMVGLGLGMRAGSIAIFAGVVAVIALSNLLQAAIYGVMIAVPGWIIIRLALMNRVAPNGDVEWYPAGRILCRLTGLGGIYLVLTALMHFDVPGGFESATAGYLNKLLTIPAGLQLEDRKALIDRFTPLFPGYAVISWLLMLIVNSTIAQGLLVRMGRNLRPSPAYTRMNAPEWLYWVIVIAAIFTLAGSGNVEFVARNLVLVCAIPFFFIGLGIVHVVIQRLTQPSIALTVMYILLIFFPALGLAVAILGFAEQWAGLRQRFGPSPQNTEEEEA